MNPPKYQIGDEVYVPRFRNVEKSIPCPDCCGTKALTVIMGDGEQLSINCAWCAKGYDPPRGYLIVYDWAAYTERSYIEGVERSDGTYEYRGCGWSEKEDQIALTKEAAQVIACKRAEAHNEAEQHRYLACKEQTSRSWAWNASYHRNKIKQAQKDIEYHTAKLNVAKVKAKEGEPVTA